MEDNTKNAKNIEEIVSQDSRRKIVALGKELGRVATELKTVQESQAKVITKLEIFSNKLLVYGECKFNHDCKCSPF